MSLSEKLKITITKVPQDQWREADPNSPGLVEKRELAEKTLRESPIPDWILNRHNPQTNQRNPNNPETPEK